MGIEMISILLFGGMFLLLALGLPVAFVLGGLATVFTAVFWGPESLFIIVARTFSMMSTTTLVAAPLFVLMATVLERSGVAEGLYEMMYRWSGGLRGGLAVGTVLACTLIAAMSGIASTGVVVMGVMALPAMLKRGYDKRLATGCILAGGVLGPLIPPSISLVLYGTIAQVSIGGLFAGGMGAGILCSFLIIGYILLRCYINPELGPAIPLEERADWKGKVASLKGVILPLLLIIAVLGSIYSGIATPTEAAAVGALGAFVCSAIHRRLNWELIKSVAYTTIQVQGFMMWILFAAQGFAAVYMGLGASRMVIKLVETYEIGWWAMLIGIQVVWFLLGCVIDAWSILMITLPILLPILPLYGFDPLWLGVLYAVNTQTGYLTPPFGTMLFLIKGIAPKEVTMNDIYRSIVPFVATQLVCLALCIIFPKIVTWLPNLLFN
ncbi:MAG: Sialic acid TRAP transporter permease protein SiaT [Synergistetes bacterium ADurb.Bin155]|jgi:tripartite ATP-independent transporter DctM subunit|nr:TRAP transporter large permease subunit [Synergistales bacterium]MBP8995530.1 TRAP transporter large permease subunit [Synergistales bacterium]NMD18115.1 TRAP transporter large permease subunit [Synergistaceae bacterium]OQB46826.1 MAG: Sialic acid TRAP transporter permease protein SiaT [Synergistetes bacterium ADurb.Bin155]HQL02956.1 TRAP transporter large permease subunit [Synergistales bacterium]